jgi:hypothetical protein
VSGIAASAGGLRTALLVLLGATCVGLCRGRAAEQHKHAKETSDVYVLPPAREVTLLSLGYRSALADVLWAHVLVSQGLHSIERRRFDNLTRLLDAINELEPTFREPYIMADALITFQANTTPEDEVRKAREIMERGARNCPLDGEIWLILGEFVGFIAPNSYLTDPVEQDAWRMDGARMLARAAELGGDNANISWQAIGGAGILSRAGERDAAIRFLRRTLAVTDDEELKQHIQQRLDALEGEEEAAADRRRQQRFADLWRRDLPFVDKSMLLLLGPPLDPAFCAGGAHQDDLRCAMTWEQWADRQPAE